MNPYVFVPILVVYPIAQILFFAYLGRSAGVASDSFFLIGNTFCAASVAAMFGMGQAIGGERRFQTLPVLLASPANRLTLYAGRAVPTVLMGFLVAMIAFVCGAAILGVHVGESEAVALTLALMASCFTCAGLGLCIGSLGLRGRSVGLFADVIAGGLLIVSGANVPLDRLPGLVQRFVVGRPAHARHRGGAFRRGRRRPERDHGSARQGGRDRGGLSRPSVSCSSCSSSGKVGGRARSTASNPAPLTTLQHSVTRPGAGDRRDAR